MSRGALEPVEAYAARVMEIVCDQHLRLATAESCTGGLLAATLTGAPGVSHGFERGYVVYTEEAKRNVLDVPEGMLWEFTAVSAPVAVWMAEAALTRSRADIAIAVTGYADGADAAGLVHFALARRGVETTHVERQFDDRGRNLVRVACVRTALGLLEQALQAAG